MLKKMFFLCMSGLIFNSAALSANAQDNQQIRGHIHRPVQRVTQEEVAGIYSFWGFSNSLSGAGTLEQPQSQAVVGQVEFFANGTGTIRFADLTVVVDDQITTQHFETVPFTYTLGTGLVNGYGTATVENFPVPGTTPTFAISFKMRNGHVHGFTQLVTEVDTASGSTARWTLLQGKRFN